MNSRHLWRSVTFAVATFTVCIFTAYHACPVAMAEDLATESITFDSWGENPVFAAEAGQWDTKIRERGWILKEESGWKLWYTGYIPDQQPPTMSLGLAISQDGIAWTRSSENPIISDFWIEDMMVVRQGADYFMFAEAAENQSQLLKSTDGVHWDRMGELDVRQTNGQPVAAGPLGTPTGFYEDGVWNLFYERRDAGIWLARSTDMRIWTNVSDDPLIVPGPEEFDTLMIAMNQVIRVNDTYVAVLHGTSTPIKPRQWCTYLATSTDLVHWTKDARGPLRPVSENKSSGQLLHDGRQWRLYTMHDKVDVHFPRLLR